MPNNHHPSVKIFPVTYGSHTFDPFVKGIPRKLSMPCVYVLSMIGTGFVKVGSTSNMRARLQTMQSSSPYEIQCKFLLCPPEGVSHVMVETSAHELLSGFRERGEWFSVSVEDAVKAVMLST